MTKNVLKNRSQICSSLDNEIIKKLKDYSAKTSIPISRILDKAVSAYLRSVDNSDPS